MKYKKKYLAILIPLLIPTVSSASSIIPNYGDNLLNNNSITKEVYNDNTASSLISNDKVVYPKDNLGNYITKDNVMIIDYNNASTPALSGVFGGYCLNSADCSVTNTNVIINSGKLNEYNSGTELIAGAHISVDSGSDISTVAKGAVYFNGGTSTEMYGASIQNYIDNSLSPTEKVTLLSNVEGDLYFNGGNIRSYRSAGANNSSYVTGLESLLSSDIHLITKGNAYVTGGDMSGLITGAYVSGGGGTLKAHNTNYSIYSEAEGNVYFTSKTTSAVLNGVESNVHVDSFTDQGSSHHTINVSSKGNVFIDGGVARYATGVSNQSASSGGIYKKVNRIDENNTIIGNVYITDGEVTSDATGVSHNISLSGMNFTGNFSGSVVVNNSKVQGNIYGVNNSTYYLNDVSGDEIFTLKASGNVSLINKVETGSASEIWGSNLLRDDSAFAFDAENNVIDRSDYISKNYYYDIFSDNTLTMASNAINVSKMGNFENYNFYINDNNKDVINSNSKALITVSGEVTNDDTITNSNGTKITTKNTSTATIQGISGKNIVKEGDSIVLINAKDASLNQGGVIYGSTTNDSSGKQSVDMTSLFGKTPTSNSVAIGLARKADISYVIDNANQTVTATIENIRANQAALKPLAEGRIAALQNTTRSADLLMNALGENKSQGTFTPIAIIDGGINTYRSGSSVDTRDYRIIVGSRYQFLDNLYSGVTVEYGRSNYETNNWFDTGRVDGDGHSSNYGVSLFTKYTYNLDIGNIYANGVFRFGRTDTEFKSNDIIMGNGNIAHYKSKVNYIGGIVGGGYLYPLNDKSNLDSSLHYLYTHLGSDSVVLDDEKVNFNSSVSSRIQLKEQYNFKSSENVTVYIAGTYEYEFKGESKGNVSGLSINAPSVQGATGILDVGVKTTPLVDNKDFKLNINVKGYGGKRDGIGASLLMEYDF